MKHAYLIIAHKIDFTLTTLLEMIDDKRNDIFLHMDAKNKAFKTSQLPVMKYSRLFITDRISVNWGGESQIRCEMILFKVACSNGPYAYYHLLSGQDLPIKTQDYIHDFFDENQGKEFIQFQSKDFSFIDRVGLFHFFQEYRGRGNNRNVMSIIEGLSLRIQKVLGIKRRYTCEFQKGAEWVSVTDKFVRQLIEYELWIKKVFRYSVCCDEVYKQTFAINYGFADKLYDQNYDDSPMAMQRLIDWDRGNPYIWTINEKEEIINSNMMFARKFDENVDKEIIVFLKNYLVCRH